MVNTEKRTATNRVLVLLARSDKSNAFEFKCPDCGLPVTELYNCEVLGMSDVIDFDSRGNTIVSVPHRGRLPYIPGHSKPGYCRTRYCFTLGEVA